MAQFQNKISLWYNMWSGFPMKYPYGFTCIKFQSYVIIIMDLFLINIHEKYYVLLYANAMPTNRLLVPPCLKYQKAHNVVVPIWYKFMSLIGFTLLYTWSPMLNSLLVLFLLDFFLSILCIFYILSNFSHIPFLVMHMAWRLSYPLVVSIWKARTNFYHIRLQIHSSFIKAW